MAANKTIRADSKVASLCRSLRAIAIEYGPHAKLPRFEELCTLLETSRVTLSEVLNELEEQDVIYRQHSKGIFVSPHIHRKNICVVFNSSYFIHNGPSPFWGLLWGLLAQEAQHREASQQIAHLFSTVFPPEKQSALLPEDVRQRVLAGRVHGAIGIGLSPLEIEWLLEHHVPCVTFAGAGPWMIRLDTVELVRIAVKSLALQNCRRLEIWLPYFDQNEELSSFLSQTMINRGLFFESVHIRMTTREQLLPQAGYQLAFDAFQGPHAPRPDGLIILNDMMTDGALSAFLANGVRVGTDVRIATHANAGTMFMFNIVPGIVVIDFDPMDIVQALFSLLDQLMSDNTLPETNIAVAPHVRTLSL